MGARGSKVFNGGLISYDFLGMDYENGSYLAYSTLTSGSAVNYCVVWDSPFPEWIDPSNVDSWTPLFLKKLLLSGSDCVLFSLF